MGTPAENLMDTFEQLPDTEKREVASAILRRTLKISFPPVTDEELVLSAEETFLELDRREAESAGYTWEGANVPWLNSIIQNGQTVLIAAGVHGPGTDKEIEYLKTIGGYITMGDKLVSPH